MDIENVHLELFVTHYDLLNKWAMRKGGCYCPVDILSIGTTFKLGPGRNGNTVGTDRQYDYYYLYALLDDSLRDINRTMEYLNNAHPSDKAFWKEALDWFEVGPMDDDSSECYLFWKILLPSHNGKELCNEINKIEQYFREQQPDSKLEFTKPNTSSVGCYVATAVYGSYDCPEVWTLRRFRDQRLGETGLGRAFIKCYYAISPAVVRYFGKSAIFNRFFRKHLDRLVARLQREGIESAPYQDK